MGGNRSSERVIGGSVGGNDVTSDNLIGFLVLGVEVG